MRANFLVIEAQCAVCHVCVVCAHFHSRMVRPVRKDGYWTLVLGFAGSTTVMRDF